MRHILHLNVAIFMVFIFLETFTPGKFQKIANFEKIAKF